MSRRLMSLGWVAGASLMLLSTTVNAGEVSCSVTKPVFPMFDGSCRDGCDCRAAIHQINCCGSRAAIGINYLEQERFDEAEAICEAQYPACDCFDRGILADDGQSTFDAARVAAFCNEGTCATFVLPEK